MFINWASDPEHGVTDTNDTRLFVGDKEMNLNNLMCWLLVLHFSVHYNCSSSLPQMAARVWPVLWQGCLPKSGSLLHNMCLQWCTFTYQQSFYNGKGSAYANHPSHAAGVLTESCITLSTNVRFFPRCSGVIRHCHSVLMVCGRRCRSLLFCLDFMPYPMHCSHTCSFRIRRKPFIRCVFSVV